MPPGPDEAPPAFLAVDLDNVHLGALGPAKAEAAARLDEALRAAEALLGWRVAAGYGSMNTQTRRDVGAGVLEVLERWRVRVQVVETAPEEADKHIFFALALASRDYERFVLVSKDKGYAKAAQALRAANGRARLAVVVDRATGALRELYARVEGVRLVELEPAGGGVARASRPVAADRGRVLVCPLCGWRRLHHAGPAPRCHHCGGVMASPAASAPGADSGR